MALGCLGSSGYISGENIRSGAVAAAALARQIAAAAIAIDNANRLIDNYKDQRDIAQRSIDIAREQQDQLRTVFWPREAQFLAEFSTPEAIETVEAMGSRYAGRLVSSVAQAFAVQLKEARCSFSRYCTSANRKLIQDLMLARGTAIANARVLGRNIAFAEYQARTDVNLSRRMQAVAIGRGLVNQAMSLYAAAGQGFAAAGGVLGAQLNSALEAFGYARQQGREARMQVEAWNTQEQGAAPTARMPGTVAEPSWNGQQLPGTINGFGAQSSGQSMFDLNASDVMRGDESGLSKTSPYTNFKELTAEKMNDSKIGNNDLARTGKFIFPVIGAPGSVIVDLSKFPLQYVDDKTAGDF